MQYQPVDWSTVAELMDRLLGGWRDEGHGGGDANKRECGLTGHHGNINSAILLSLSYCIPSSELFYYCNQTSHSHRDRARNRPDILEYFSLPCSLSCYRYR